MVIYAEVEDPLRAEASFRGQPFIWQYDDLRYTFTIEPEEGKLNINSSDMAWIERTLQQAGFAFDDIRKSNQIIVELKQNFKKIVSPFPLPARAGSAARHSHFHRG